MDIVKILEEELKISKWQIENTIELIDDGNTIPFIARYRKEKTGSLSDEILREFSDRLNYLRNLDEKKNQVISLIDEQGNLTEELKQEILNAKTLVEVDDLYRPFRPKKRTKATIAKEKGLEPLALIILEQKTDSDIEEIALTYINEDLEVITSLDAINGAKDIIAEIISDNADYRKRIRFLTFKEGLIISKAKNEELESVYEMYYNYEEKITNIAGHRVLAINRGEKEKLLSVKVEAPFEKILIYLEREILKNNKKTEKYIKEAIEDSYKRLIAPAIEREIRNEITEKAEENAIKVFGKNLHQLLMQPPISNRIVLALDPGFRTGCKVAIVDETGKVLQTGVIYPTFSDSKVIESKKYVIEAINKYKVDIIAIGNGTASRETESFVANLLKEINSDINYIIVNEAGASVYSASKLGTEEFPDFDVSLRSAVSIGRRLQDPLSELVKIEPKAIGVGQYQHDMNPKKLDEALSGVVENCVNSVGVDINTASVALLQYIAGVSKAIAKNIVDYREQKGFIEERKELLSVSKLGPKAYEQCAGFLRIRNGKNPLDNTAVHPESYNTVYKILKDNNCDIKKLDISEINSIKSKIDYEKVSKDLNIGEATLKDIIKELEKPGRDPRDDMPKPILRNDILEMSDLKEGMVLKGTVRNVIDFGAFIDIGVHQDGLVHISEICNNFIKHPLDAISVGDIVDVKILNVDIKKKRISLSMKI